ncbi:hypothetical protein [Kamptonema formosum]|uniref:hypothetical protein n=1 Tax=Kamptonema formosum TaxID=331992 RepID=UPI0003739428|nr:hypothetical protein [Oscillatoria sp. PCC 10802]
MIVSQTPEIAAVSEEQSLKALKSNPDRRHGLELAEYASVIGSAVGTIVAGLSGQVLYAATPLTLALSLNLVNRHRFEQQTKASVGGAGAAIAQLDLELREEIESVRAGLAALPPSERIRDIEASMLRLSNLWAGVQQRFGETTSPLQNQQVQQEFAIVRRAILRLRDSTDANMATLRASLSQEIESLHRLVAQPAGADGVQETSPWTEGSAPESQMPVRLEISELRQRIEQLEQKYREIVKPYLKRLMSDVKHLQEQSDTAPVRAALADLRAQVESLVTELDAQLLPQQVQGLRPAAAVLSESIAERQGSCQIAAVPVKSVEG